MQVTWLGQAGLIFECPDTRILVDPYFSDSVGRRDPAKSRRVPVMSGAFDLHPDVVIFTHDHLDHYDPETAERIITPGAGITVLAPASVWNRMEKPAGNNFVIFNPGTVWTMNGIRFSSVPAEHSDPYAVGVVIDMGGRKYYITGDTLYNERIFSHIPGDIHAVFLPVNGAGNNMNMTDAKAFCERISPEVAVPIHCGMFDDIDMNEFGYVRKCVPKLYERIDIKP